MPLPKNNLSLLTINISLISSPFDNTYEPPEETASGK